MAKKKTLQSKPITKVAGIEGKARDTKSRIKLSGSTTRMKGHVQADTRRAQSKRDKKNG